MATANTVSENAQPALGEPPDVRLNAEDLPETLIEAGRRRWRDDLKEIWARRELLYFLIWRDIKVRYRDTFLSGGWALFQPMLMTAVFTIFYGAGAVDPKNPPPIPYPLFVYSGLIAWYFFAAAIMGASMSVVSSESLITKVYFPRLILPIATVGTCLADLLIASMGLVALMIHYRHEVAPGWSLLLLPVWIILCAFAGIGVGTLWAALNVRYKDFRFLSAFLIQAWMFSTPAIFDPRSEAPRAEIAGSQPFFAGLYGFLKTANPVNSLIVSFRKVALGGEAPWESLGIAAIVIAILMVIGFMYFRRVEDSFADVI
jgi:lipopolysaccharide transport system permease protein